MLTQLLLPITAILPLVLTAALPADPAQRPFLSSPRRTPNSPLPVILWHGLGDRSDADGLADVADLLEVVHPGTRVHVVSLGEDGAADQRASFFGSVTDQVADLCATLSGDPTFTAANGRVDALGFSQGGLFLRGLVQSCPGVSVRSLVTFGSPHDGVADLPACGTWDLLCRGAESALKAGRWSTWVQSNVVPAQYFREVDEATGEASEEYLENSGWLADVNNEKTVKNGEYRKHLGKLERFVMYGFEEDKTLLPKETAWFAQVNTTTGEVTRLQDRKVYGEDWLGLKVLDKKGGLIFRMVKKAGHMQLTDKLLRRAFGEFFGPERELSVVQKVESVASSAWEKVSALGLSDIPLIGGDW